jgi:hypothetical protein
VRAVSVAEHADKSARDRGLAGAGVADHPYDDCAWHRLPPYPFTPPIQWPRS